VNVLDYDDLLLYWAEMMGNDDLAAEMGGRFDHILIDEYQDTNRQQSKILLRLKPEGRGLMVVGDDTQLLDFWRWPSAWRVKPPRNPTNRQGTRQLEVGKPSQRQFVGGLPHRQSRRQFLRTCDMRHRSPPSL
jgi:UvrD-like helicase family protein